MSWTAARMALMYFWILAAEIVERVVLLGAPISIKDENWEAARKVHIFWGLTFSSSQELLWMFSMKMSFSTYFHLLMKPSMISCFLEVGGWKIRECLLYKWLDAWNCFPRKVYMIFNSFELIQTHITND